MARYTRFFGLGLTLPFLACGLCLTAATTHADEGISAGEAVAVGAGHVETPPITRDAAIKRLRDIAYGKDADGDYKEPSARVREAAQEALKQLVIEEVQMKQAAAKGGKAGAVVAPSGSSSVTPANYRQDLPADHVYMVPANAANAIPQASPPADNWFLPGHFEVPGVVYSNFQAPAGGLERERAPQPERSFEGERPPQPEQPERPALRPVKPRATMLPRPSGPWARREEEH